MTNSAIFDRYLERLNAGERLSADDITALASTPDILPLGMLADSLRRRMHDGRVTYVRVASCAFDAAFTDAVPPSAREIRITGAPSTLEEATAAVVAARAVAGNRAVSAFSWRDIERFAEAAHDRLSGVLETLRDAGLDAVADLPLDTMSDAAVAIDRLTASGFQRLCLGIEKAPAADRVGLLLRAAALQDEFACIQAINPLPATLNPLRPTTGYEDVKMVAIARLAAPNIPSIQIDWLRYGPKLAQVALTFGGDDVYGVSASDDASEGRRRAPLEEIRRNIEAAGFEPAERDGHFKSEVGSRK
jgi:aminodeoxyfutalosine synthase